MIKRWLSSQPSRGNNCCRKKHILILIKCLWLLNIPSKELFYSLAFVKSVVVAHYNCWHRVAHRSVSLPSIDRHIQSLAWHCLSVPQSHAPVIASQCPSIRAYGTLPLPSLSTSTKLKLAPLFKNWGLSSHCCAISLIALPLLSSLTTSWANYLHVSASDIDCPCSHQWNKFQRENN